MNAGGDGWVRTAAVLIAACCLVLWVAGATSLATRQGFVLAVFGLALVYLFLCAARFGSGPIGLVFLVLAGSSYPHVLSAATNPVAAWNLLAIWGFIFHAGNFVWKGGIAQAVAASAFAMLLAGGEFPGLSMLGAPVSSLAAEIGLVSLVMAGWLGLKWCAAEFRDASTALLRPDWQVAAAGIATGAACLAAAVVVARLAGMDAPLHVQLAWFAPGAAVGAVWLRGVREACRLVVQPLPHGRGSETYGAATVRERFSRLGFLLPAPFLILFGLAVLGQRQARVQPFFALALVLLICCAVFAAVPRLAGWLGAALANGAGNEFGSPGVRRLFLVLTAGGIVQALLPASIETPPLLASAVMLVKAAVLAGLFRGALLAHGPARTLRVVAAILLVGDHAAVQAANWVHRSAPDLSWISFVKQRSDASFAISGFPGSAAVFNRARVVGLEPGVEAHIAGRIAARAPIFKAAETIPLPAGRSVFRPPDYWIYLRAESAADARCRQDYLLRYAGKLAGGRNRVSIRRAAVQPQTSWPGASIAVRVEFASMSDAVESVAVLSAAPEDPDTLPEPPEPDPKAPILTRLHWDCTIGSAYGTLQLPPPAAGARLPYRLNLPVRIRYENGETRVAGSVAVVVSHSVGEEPPAASPPPPSPRELAAELATLPCVSCTGQHAIFDLREYNRREDALP